MEKIEFSGFGGVRLVAEAIGSSDDPSVLLIHRGTQSRRVWTSAAKALADAGRYAVNIDLRGHGESEWPADGRYDIDAFAADLRAVLAQMNSRPVIVAARINGWIAMEALKTAAAELAAGLVLVDLPMQYAPEISASRRQAVRDMVAKENKPPEWDLRMLDSFDASAMPERLRRSAPDMKIPVYFVRGALSEIDYNQVNNEFVNLLPNAEFLDVEDASLLLSEERMDSFVGLLQEILERRHPRQAPEYRSGSDPRTLRDAMGCFGTGVTVVTAVADDGKPIGFTANSFTSVSLDPPLLLVCVANSSKRAESYRRVERFAVNVLQIGQQPVSNRFAASRDDKFSEVSWEMGEFGSPVLHGSLTAYECETYDVNDAGDHFILIGRVLKATFDTRRDPLLFFRGKYRRLHFA